MKRKLIIFILLLVVLVSVSVVSAGNITNAKDTAYKINETMKGKMPYTETFTYNQIVSAGYTPTKINSYGRYRIDIKQMYYDEYNGTMVTYINAFTSERNPNGDVYPPYRSIQINNPVRWYMPFNDTLNGAALQQAYLTMVISYLDSLPYGLPINDDTLLIYPSVDGYAAETTSAAYATIRADAGDSAVSGANPVTTSNSPLLDSPASGSGNYHIFRRGILSFDTSAIPDDATISSAKFGVYVTAQNTELGTPAYGITGGTLASNTSLAAGDYDGWSATRYASDISISTSARNNWTLNGAGLANISKTQSTIIYLRDSWDINASMTGTWTKNSESSITWNTVGATAANRPYLVVVYTPAAPVAAFTKDKSSGDYPLTVTFTDTTTAGNPITAWKWVFGDGDTTNDSVQNPIHTFNSAGTFNVNLTVTNSVGSNTSATQAITVTSPSVGFDPTGYGNWTEFWVNSTSAQTDYQVTLLLDNRTGMSTTTLFYTNGTTRSDWADVAWTDTSNATLGFWKENRTDTSTNTTWWIKVPSIANDNTTKIRLFYGNASQTLSYMNGTGTFNFFDDFDGTTVNTDKWTVKFAGLISVGNSIINVSGNLGWINSKSQTFGQNTAVRSRAQLHKTTTTYGIGYDLADNSQYGWIRADDVTGQRRFLFKTAGVKGTDFSPDLDENYHVWEVKRDSVGLTATGDGTQLGTLAWTSTTQTGTSLLAEAGHSYYDWLVIRKITATEPFLTLAVAGGGGASAPVASFTVNKNMVRIPNNITVTDTTTNTPTSWAWSWGDGSANSTTQNPTHQYLKRGQWSIILTATNAGGSGTSSATNVKVIGYENYY